MTLLVPEHAKECGAAYEGAEAALFDEISAPLRLSAFRFLVVWGATERRRSEKVWPIIDEAIQCYHGDLEYRDMLALLFSFAHGQISGSVAAELAGRLQFDAENGKGSYLRVRSREISDALVKRFKLDNFSFAHGQISGSVAAELAGRLQFDAENGKGSYLRVRSREISDALVKRFKLDNPQKTVRAKKSDAEDEDEE